MSEVVAYHVVFCTHGFWLPNDPRGSKSIEVRAEALRRFGPATSTSARQSVAALPHDKSMRQAAKQTLVYPEVVFDGHQALAIARGFAKMVAKSKYLVHACSILPSHIHLVIRRHSYSIEQVVRLLRQAGTRHLLSEGRHPFADERSLRGRLPSVWAQDFWKVFLFTADDIRRSVLYLERNPERDGKRPQHWSFVTPFTD